jgi:serine/threonine-protein kinase
MALSTRVLSAGKFALIGAALVATFVLSAAIAMRVALRASEVPVPDLRGRTVNEASAALAEIGLALRVDEARRLDPEIPTDRIVVQDPAAGVTARRQRTVRAWLSAGQRASTIPRLEGQTQRNAQLRLSQDNLGLAEVAEIRSGEYPEDVVVAQEPPADTRAANVALLVNRGERSSGFVMPDLIGVNGDRAAELLRTRGFRVAVVSEQPYPGVPAGIVLRQAPQGGFEIAPGEAISLEVSR